MTQGHDEGRRGKLDSERRHLEYDSGRADEHDILFIGNAGDGRC